MADPPARHRAARGAPRTTTPVDGGSVAAPRLVIGLNPVREALRAHGAAVERVLVEHRPGPRPAALARFAADQGATVESVPRAELDRLAGGAPHQGVAAWAPLLALTPLEALVTAPEQPVLALDGLQDPQNFGAVIRSAVGLTEPGAAVLWAEHASAPLSPATFRASAGAIEFARLCRVPALPSALLTLAEAGFRVVALDPEAPTALGAVDLTGPTVLVLGSEGEGLARGTRRAVTDRAHLVRTRRVQSLNASVAAALGLYELTRQRAAREA